VVGILFDIASNPLPSFRVLEKIFDALSKVVPSDYYHRNGDQGQFTHKHHDEEHGLLKAIELVQFDRIEAGVAYCRAA